MVPTDTNRHFVLINNDKTAEIRHKTSITKHAVSKVNVLHTDTI